MSAVLGLEFVFVDEYLSTSVSCVKGRYFGPFGDKSCWKGQNKIDREEPPSSKLADFAGYSTGNWDVEVDSQENLHPVAHQLVMFRYQTIRPICCFDRIRNWV